MTMASELEKPKRERVISARQLFRTLEIVAVTLAVSAMVH